MGYGLAIGSIKEIGCSVTTSPRGKTVNPHDANQYGPSVPHCRSVYNTLVAGRIGSLAVTVTLSKAQSYRCQTWTSSEYRPFGDYINITSLMSKLIHKYIILSTGEHEQCIRPRSSNTASADLSTEIRPTISVNLLPCIRLASRILGY